MTSSLRSKIYLIFGSAFVLTVLLASAANVFQYVSTKRSLDRLLDTRFEQLILTQALHQDLTGVLLKSQAYLLLPPQANDARSKLLNETKSSLGQLESHYRSLVLLLSTQIQDSARSQEDIEDLLQLVQVLQPFKTLSTALAAKGPQAAAGSNLYTQVDQLSIKARPI